MGLGERQVLKLDQGGLNPLITFILRTEDGEGDGLDSGQEFFQLGHGGQGFDVHDGFHPPIMPEPQPGVRLTSW